MLNAKDLELLAAKGISEKQIEEQLACFVKGFPFLEITASASVERGIMVIPQEKQATYMDAWDAYLAKNKKIVKFVPASGAASRMFKNLYEFLSADYNEPQNAFEKKFFDDIRKFAFYDALNRACIENEAKDIPALIALGQYKAVVSNLLESKGLNYGQLPKGLLLFHSYPQTARTAMEEHLAEGAMYAKNNAGEVNIHFTVSPEHKALFEQLVAAKTGDYEEKFSVKYDISFSVQKPSTDTIAADMANNPFRDKNGICCSVGWPRCFDRKPERCRCRCGVCQEHRQCGSGQFQMLDRYLQEGDRWCAGFFAGTHLQVSGADR